MKIETVLSPTLFHQIENIENKVVVVIDILRATSTITTILHNGASAVIPVKEEQTAKDYKVQGFLVGGEREGQTIEGFDFGNSPFQYKPEIVKDKEIVLTTTNGTKCIEMSNNAYQVVIGSFLNLDTDAYRAAQADLFKALQNSSHFQRLARKGVTKDIAYCCETNVIDSVGILKDGKIILA